MTERSLVDLAEAAGTNSPFVSASLVTSSTSTELNDSRERIYSSLRYGAFLLAYAPLESFFTQLTQYANRANGRALPLNLDKIQRELALQWPEADSGKPVGGAHPPAAHSTRK